MLTAAVHAHVIAPRGGFILLQPSGCDSERLVAGMRTQTEMRIFTEAITNR
jgi:hypothetical protein